MLKKTNDSLEYQRLLSRYPKKRIRLSYEYKKIYNEHYMLNRGGKGITNMLSQKMESWMHKKVSKVSATNILEIGAGNLNHIDYETNFTNYDIVEPFKELYINNPLKKKVRKVFKSLENVEGKYDKILSIATLEHILNLPKEIDLCKKISKRKWYNSNCCTVRGRVSF